MTTTKKLPALEDIYAARERLRETLTPTPLAGSDYISRLWGRRVLFKLENLQSTGSFKERGALNKMLCLDESQRTAGVITASAGNHGQAVAFHAQRLGIPATIVMPEFSPLIKVQNCIDLGARTILHGSNFDAAGEHAREIAQEESLTYVHGFDDFEVIAGQGTVALEIMEQCPEVDCVVAAIGGGGLIAGAAVALKETNPRIRVIGVQAEGIASMRAAVENGNPVAVPAYRTIADGISVRRAGDLPFELVERYVDEIVTVSEEEIAQAILLMLEREKTVVEGAVAVGVAAMHNRRISRTGKCVVVILSGGNIDVNLLSRVIDKGLVKDGRLMRLRVTVPDYPGQLSRILEIVAATRANVLEISHGRAFAPVRIGQTCIDIVLETRGAAHVQELFTELQKQGVEASRLD